MLLEDMKLQSKVRPHTYESNLYIQKNHFRDLLVILMIVTIGAKLSFECGKSWRPPMHFSK